MSDYSKSLTRQSGTTTIYEPGINVAFQVGQRDAEQGWTANASRWNYSGALAAVYHAGFCQPRSRV